MFKSFCVFSLFLLSLNQMVNLLIERGATINAYDKKDRRAIHWAAYMGHVEVVKILVDHGAELNCRDKQVGCQPKKLKKTPKKPRLERDRLFTRYLLYFFLNV